MLFSFIQSKRTSIFFIFLLLSAINLFSAKKIDDLSFTNTEITEVLKTISEVFEITIVPDRDVQGVITRYFKDMDLERSLIYLLEPLDFTYEVKDGVYFVKVKPPFKVDYDEVKKIFNIKAVKARLQEIINEISLKSKETIIFDGSATDIVSINIFDKDLAESLRLLTETLKYDIKKEGSSYYVKKKEEDTFFTDAGKSTGVSIKGDESNIQLKIYNQSSNDVILALFRKFNKKLSLLSTKNIKIPYLDITNVTFDELLNVLFQHTNQALSRQNDTYYIYDSLATKDSNPYRISAAYKLKNLDSKTFQLNVPSQIVPQSSYRLDPENNEVIIVGSPVEVDQYLSFIKTVDESKDGVKTRIFKPRNLDVKKIKNYLPERYLRLKLTVIEEQNIFTAVLDETDYQALKDYLEIMDITVKREYRYKFKYLDPEEVLKTMLPKAFKADQFMLNKNDSALICSISENEKESLFGYFETIDVPHPVIRYQVLIVEYTEKKSFNYNWGIGSKSADNPLDFFNFANWGLQGGIFQNGSSAITASFDIPTIFGNYFSANLSFQLSQDTAKIKMASEVYGLSGEKVNIASTKTEQTRDEIYDVETKVTKPVYTATTYGLSLEVKGRTTSSDEVYIEVNAKHSDTWGRSEGAPNTSEKTVKNTIRTRTGKPIALGGLNSNRETKVNNKIPLLGDIPFIGNLFKTHDNENTNSEFIIYIIPFIQKSEEDLKKERREYVKKIYDYFFE